MHDDQQRGADELQGPEADVRDGEEMVVADISAARLESAALKVPLIISPHLLRRYHIDQEAEDKDHREPDAPQGCGVLVHPTQEVLAGSHKQRVVGKAGEPGAEGKPVMGGEGGSYLLVLQAPAI
uniref:Uncharacterized protein n=1 Tax=Crocodylus porosus TaxID=8502 RepID=A0A7M4DUY4_CROPO